MIHGDNLKRLCSRTLIVPSPEGIGCCGGSLKAIGLGIACFLLAFFLSLLITIPWSQHYWAGEAQAELGGLVLSFYFGIASGIAAAVYILRRIIRSNR
jgi:nitrate reductase gamma subunit